MLVRRVAQEFEGIQVEVQNFGQSPLATRYGVARYPAIFVDDVLIARPKDFGFYGETGSQGTGRYTPWQSPVCHEMFCQDLRRALQAARRGDYAGLKQHEVEAESGEAISTLPAFDVIDLQGNPITTESLSGKVVIVEFWATWCPPCVQKLPWLSQLQGRYEDDLMIVGIAIESSPADVQRLAREVAFPVVVGGPEVARAFGDVIAVPTMFVFDSSGSLRRTAYGAPPELASEIETLLAGWLGDSEERDR